MMYFNGEGIEKNVDTAMQCFFQGTHNQLFFSQWKLAECYLLKNEPQNAIDNLKLALANETDDSKTVDQVEEMEDFLRTIYASYSARPR